MTALAPADLGKLAKVCGLFGSDHDGERAAAAAHADRIVRAAGLEWADVLVPNVPPAGHSQASRLRENPEKSWHRELTPSMILATYGAGLTGWEKCFLAGLVTRPAWSDRQREVFAEIRARFQ